MTTIETGARLHFGLLSLAEPGVQTRAFGGVGLMVDDVGVRLRVQKAQAWRASGTLAERALLAAKQCAAQLNLDQAFELFIDAAPAEHIGLGTGTQLGLAVALGICTELNECSSPAPQPTAGANPATLQLARLAGRGLRSGLGVHGFRHGGFLVDGGKGPHTSLAPLLFHHDFPEEWRILLVQPVGPPGMHGSAEREAFAALAQTPRDDSAALCRLVLLGLLPALLERDLAAFGEALFEFNHRVGLLFAPAQKGPYAHPCCEQLVQTMRRHGLRGAGQSSWGPTVFALAEEDRLRHFAARHFAPGHWRIVPARNTGAQKKRCQDPFF